MALLRKISTPDGFLAAPTEKANYRRVWSRDGVIIGLAALLSEDDELIESFERTLCTLARHQGPQGEIPSNVDTVGGRVSYGGTTGRVDADLWFIVGCVEYWSATGDESFLGQMLPVLFVNVMASLLGVADDARRARVDGFISRLVDGAPQLLPAFHPVIEPLDEDWQHLQVTFSHTFKNNPYEYHNGRLWPMLTGFYVADLASRGKREDAARFRDRIHWANSLAADGEPWSFPEYVHGLHYTAGGTVPQGWSAAAAVMARHALEGKPVFRVSTR